MRWLLCSPPFPTTAAFVSDSAWTLFLTVAEEIVFRKSEFNELLLVLLLSQPLSPQPLKEAKCFPSSLEEGRGYC